MSGKLARRLASEIIKELSTNGAGKQARRLVLEMEDGRDGGGWALYAAQSKVEKILREHLARKKSAQHRMKSDGAKCGCVFDEQGNPVMVCVNHQPEI